MDSVTLWQGDCLELMKQIPSGSINLVLCDLPYGTTQNKWDAVIPFVPMWDQYARICRDTSPIVLFAAQPFTSVLVASNLKDFKYTWVWKKSQAVGHLNAWKQPMRNTEDIVVFYKKQCPYSPILVDKKPENIRPLSNRTRTSSNYGDHKLDVHKCPNDKTMPATVLEFNNAQGTVHPTQKPVALMEYLIQTYTKEGDLVLDNCMGSGTTGVACINTNRRFIGIEKDEGYFQIAKNRINQALKTRLGDTISEHESSDAA